MKTLVKHVRVENFKGDRVPVATIVAIYPNCIGVSVCNLKDHFKKSRGIHIATQRACIGVKTKIPNRVVYYSNFCPITLESVLHTEIEIMKERANRYFKSVLTT